MQLNKKSTSTLFAASLAALLLLTLSSSARPAEACGYSPEFGVQIAMESHFDAVHASTKDPRGKSLIAVHSLRLFEEKAVALIELTDDGHREYLFVTLEGKAYVQPWKVVEVSEASVTARAAVALIEAFRKS